MLLLNSILLPSVQAQHDPALQLQVDVVYLASDLLQGRETGKKGERMAADYIAYRFEEIGLAPKGYGGAWYQDFEVQYKAHPHAKEAEARTAQVMRDPALVKAMTLFPGAELIGVEDPVSDADHTHDEDRPGADASRQETSR